MANGIKLLQAAGKYADRKPKSEEDAMAQDESENKDAVDSQMKDAANLVHDYCPNCGHNLNPDGEQKPATPAEQVSGYFKSDYQK